jgi:hypothetical protein
VRELTLRQTPTRLQVLREVLCLLERVDDCFVNVLLIVALRLWVGLFGLRLAVLKELGLR